jgi:hypothetical protein
MIDKLADDVAYLVSAPLVAAAAANLWRYWLKPRANSLSAMAATMGPL